MVHRRRGKAAADQSLPFEKEALELEQRIEAATDDAERQRLTEELQKERERVFAHLTPWQRVQVARHGARPRMLDYTKRLFEDFVELHGDRAIGDDPALICGIGRYKGHTVAVAGQQKGISTEEKVERNFGMPHPEGYRKAYRLFEMAERLRLPIMTFVDTPAAHPGIEAEQHGQGPAIARNLWKLMRVNVPVYCAVLGEGGSGGALAIAVGDWIAMLEHAIYVICPPERCAEILWRDAEKKELAASALRVTAEELKNLEVIDEVVKEPLGGAHQDPNEAARQVAESMDRFIEGCKSGQWTIERRRQRFRSMGVWGQQDPATRETAAAGAESAD